MQTSLQSLRDLVEAAKLFPADTPIYFFDTPHGCMMSTNPDALIAHQVADGLMAQRENGKAN